MNFARSNIAVLFSGIVVSWALAGCASDATEPTDEDVSTTSQAQQKAPPGGGGGGNTCLDRWQSCYAGCGGKYGGPKTSPRTREALRVRLRPRLRHVHRRGVWRRR